MEKTLKIAVLIKQVPATEHVKIDPETGVMMREGLEVEVNPLDLHAIEEAVRIKEKLSAHATAVTMGPPAAVKAARYAIAMGCDEGVVVTDRAFAGSDTLATAGVLAETLRKLGGFDLILAGERATDGETGQVGPAVGSFLGTSVLTYVSKLEFQDGRVLAERAVEGGHERLSAPLPALAVVVKEINVPRLCTLGGKLKGKKAAIRTLSFEDLGLPRERVGLAGSPTKVVKVGYPQVTRKGRKVSAARDFDGAMEELKRFLADTGAAEMPVLSPSEAKEASR
ncbi:MAG: electron transfer flavoprotein subunit beta/FixA family protein [Synergistaceae bacterium]|nr:electron transfer flavoprotein subunit beta/FixA family protein [Synergistaceae bacterium]